MIHWCSSEATAALIWLLLFLGALVWAWAAAARVPLVPPVSDVTWLELLVGLLSCCYGTRLVAAGRRCRWPADVSFAGRVAVVTGASSGVGFGCAEDLALHGWTVIMAGRDQARLLDARQRILDKLKAQRQALEQQQGTRVAVWRWLRRIVVGGGGGDGGGGGGRALILGTVDLSSEVSIRQYAAAVAEAAAKHYPVGLLINAAGVLRRDLVYTPTNWPATPEERRAAGLDGAVGGGDRTMMSAGIGVGGGGGHPPPSRPLETMLATNAVGPMLLTQLLLPVLLDTATATGVTSRIINVASSCHTFLGPALSSSALDPIQMILGLERGEGEGEGVAVAASYRVDKFTWGNFVGYYGLSKLCVIWNTRLLARQVAAMKFPRTDGAAAAGGGEQKIFVACTHPGVLTTHLYRDLLPTRVLDHLIYWPSLLIGKTWAEGAQSTLRAAVEDEGMVQGGYYLCGGEYGEQSGVNCLSTHASNTAAMMRYGQWLQKRIATPPPPPPSSTQPTPSSIPHKEEESSCAAATEDA